MAECVARADAATRSSPCRCRPFSSRLTSGKYRARRSRRPRRRRRPGRPAARGLVRRAGLRARPHAARRRGPRRLRRERVGAALHGAQRARRDHHGGRPLRGAAAADDRAARPARRCPATGASASRARAAAAASGLEPEVDDVVRAARRGGLEEGPRRARRASSATMSRRSTTSTSCCASRSRASAWSTAARTPPNDSPLFIEALADVVIDYLARRPLERAACIRPAARTTA